MPKVASDADDLSDVSEVAHDEPAPLPHPDRTSENGAAEDGESEGDGDEDDEDTYQVEAIMSHKPGRVVKYEIKWVGYPQSENTFEPVENLLPDAREILSAYHKKIGGDPALKKSKSTSDLKRSASGSESNTKRVKVEDSTDTNGSWLPQVKDWEPLIREITHIQQKKPSVYYVFIHFKNGKKTKVPMQSIYDHCPRSMLRFYERHLKFTQNEEEGDDD